MLYLFGLHVVLFSVATLALTLLRAPGRSIHFYVYIALILLVGGYLGNAYSLPIADGIVISGGNIAYAAFMMTAVLFVIVERDIFVLRRLVRLVVLVNIFNILVSLINTRSLGAPGIINPHGTPAALFQQSTPHIVLGGVLIITELFVLLIGFELLKRHVNSKALAGAGYVLGFVLVLLFDGLAFPLIAFGTSPEIVAVVIGGLPGKAVAATAFSIPLVLFMVFSRRAFDEYLESDMLTWKVFVSPSSAIIRELAANENEMRQSERVFRNSREGLAIVDDEGRLVRANDAFLDLTGLDREITGQRLPSDLFRYDGKPFSGLPVDAAATSWRGEVRYGSDYASSGILSLARNSDDPDDGPGFVWSLADITEQKAIERELDHLAMHDTLTGLGNRRALDATLRECLDDAMALLMIDLDHFKDVNDSYGHAMGDSLLRKAAEQIDGIRSDLAAPRSALFRVGADEFVVLIWSSDPSVIIAARRAVSDVFRRPLPLSEDLQVFMSVTCGASHRGVADQSDIFQEAGAALDQAKREARGGLLIFEERFTVAAQRRLRLIARLHEALDQGRLEFHLQPQFDAVSGRLRGAEALARWTDDEFGTVSPAEFIPLAEEAGMIFDLGIYFLEVVCQTLADQREQGLDPVPIAVNVSPLQIWHGDFVATVRTALDDAGIPGALLQLELTETAVLERTRDAGPLFRAIQSLGVTLAMDDFGTGYSSVSYLSSLPWNVLKIDQGFIARLSEDPAALRLTNSIVDMAKALSLEVIAEGVETEAQRDALRTTRCDMFQGFLYACPLRPEAFAALLAERQTLAPDFPTS